MSFKLGKHSELPPMCGPYSMSPDLVELIASYLNSPTHNKDLVPGVSTKPRILTSMGSLQIGSREFPDQR